MDFLEYGHNPTLAAASFAVAFVAGFTGLSLTKELSEKSIAQRKVAVAMASLALGGGIWSMHFVAMLGLSLPMLFYYDAALTLASALIAILIIAVALVMLHFTKRTPLIIVLAGSLVGSGILSMHYVGMAGLQLCRAVYTLGGIILASVSAIALCIMAIGIAYSHRTNRNLILGTLCFGAAVFVVHFVAMAGTNFVEEQNMVEFGPTISNETMALGVVLSSFIIFGAFLWVGATYLVPATSSLKQPSKQGEDSRHKDWAHIADLHIPCDRGSRKVFIASADVVFVRADGHYTQIYTSRGQHFCEWTISEATKRLLPKGFVKVHRSYVVNPSKVSRFERTKDKGRCTFSNDGVPPAPVSRSYLKDVQAAFAG